MAKAITLLWSTVLVVLALAGCFSGDSDDAQAKEVYEGEFKEFDIFMLSTNVILWNDTNGGQLRPVQVDAWLFGPSPEGPWTLPGPTIRAREGDTVRINFHMAGTHMLPHTIHWHGLHVPWDMDGVPWVSQLPIGMGEAIGNPPVSADHFFEYEFTLTQSGTYFYHCHVDTAHHMDMGMYGLFIVDPADPNQDPPYDRDYPLMLDEWDASHIHQNPNQDTLLSASGDPESSVDNLYAQLRDYYSNNPDLNRIKSGQVGPADLSTTLPFVIKPYRDWYPAQYPAYFPDYDTFLINGKSFPDTQPLYMKQGETIRLRFVNAGFEVHTMHLHGHHMLVTHKDGFLLQQPYYADSLLMGPGERYDVYVTGDNPGPWLLHDHNALNVMNDHQAPGGMSTILCYEDGWKPDPTLMNPCKAGAASDMTSGQLLLRQTELLKLRTVHLGGTVIGG